LKRAILTGRSFFLHKKLPTNKEGLRLHFLYNDKWQLFSVSFNRYLPSKSQSFPSGQHQETMNYNHLFSKIYDELGKTDDSGEVASYIPELKNINPNKFGVHLTTN